MNKSFIKKCIQILLISTIIMYLFSTTTLAAIDLSGWQTIEETTSNNQETQSSQPEEEQQQTQINDFTEQETQLQEETSKESEQDTYPNSHPKAGSNNTIFYISGITILIGTTIYIYKKTKIF